MGDDKLRLKIAFGKNVKSYRYKQHLTQEELSERLDVSQNYISRIERGIHSPDYDFVEDLAKELKVEPFQLFLTPNNLSLPRRVDMKKSE